RWHPAVASLLGVCAAALLTLVIGGLLYNASLRDANRRAEERATEALRQRKEALAPHARAEANLQDATRVLDTMVTWLQEEGPRDAATMQPWRRALVEEVLSYYQKFVKQKSTDPELRARIGTAYNRVGSLYLLLGQEAPADKAFREALRVCQELVDEFPDK